MSAKNRDNHGRWRNVTIAFRVSPRENDRINSLVRLSGLTKQDYITQRLLDKTVTVVGNPRVHKALREEMEHILQELQRIEAGQGIDAELLEIIDHVAAIYHAMAIPQSKTQKG